MKGNLQSWISKTMFNFSIVAVLSPTVADISTVADTFTSVITEVILYTKLLHDVYVPYHRI